MVLSTTSRGNVILMDSNDEAIVVIRMLSLFHQKISSSTSIGIMLQKLKENDYKLMDKSIKKVREIFD